MLQIVRADLGNSSHAEALVYLLNAYAMDPMGGGEALSDFTRANLADRLHARTDAYAVLAYDDDTPVGLVVCIEGFSTFACKPLMNIHDVVVLASHRGRDIAGKMLAEVEILAKELGCCKLTLEVLEGNGPAQSAYRRFGFAAYELDPAMGQARFWEKKLSV